MVSNLMIDQQILTIDRVICRHIDAVATLPRGVVSQDILAQLRSFIEHIMLKIYANGSDIENSYDNICKAIEFVKTRGNLKVLRRFHDFLQIVASHYTLDEENSERLMLKYYEYLLRIQRLLLEKYSLCILHNLDMFPLNTDSSMQEYYKKIAAKIESYNTQDVGKSEKFYIQRSKPFFINHQIYYEVTFTPANDYSSRHNRVIGFTRLEISDNYAVKLALASDRIEILGKTMPIIVITGWSVSIRDCEYKNFTNLIRGEAIATGYAEQQGISQFLTSTGFNLSELMDFSNSEFENIRRMTTQRSKSIVFFNDIDHCREIISCNGAGSNLIRYLLFHMNNTIMKNQHEGCQNNKLSGLYVRNGCIPFDSMPFISSPIGHNPRLSDLFSCLSAIGRQHEILARLVRNNTEIKGQLFTPLQDIVGIENIDDKIRLYNSSLWHGHREAGKLVIINNHIFVNSYVSDTKFIIRELEKLSSQGIQNYSNSVNAWLNLASHGIDCIEKKDAMIRMFDKSRVALIYGSAGTGKSRLISHISQLFADKKKLYLAQTNPAVDNLKRRVTTSNCTFLTITKFLKRQNIATEFDLLIIDECSTVSNQYMREILTKASFKLLVLVGDSYQIASIRFGNWFSVARSFVPQTSVFELTKPYRSRSAGLLTLWERVRNMDETVLEIIARQDYSSVLNVSIFSPTEDDEIILCLNYDGLYGINNINRFLQESNPNLAYIWGIQQFKINDPVLFNETDRFAPVVYNNMKGKIVGIEVLDNEETSERIQFDIQLDRVINGMDALGQDFTLLDSAEDDNSVIRFCVYKLPNTDEDDEGSSLSVVPFQIAYAVSIHKAQGLEYGSVKIVITDEIDELISHNIFYTAITRAINRLKIYWTPEVGQKVLSRIKPKDNNKDVALLRSFTE